LNNIIFFPRFNKKTMFQRVSGHATTSDTNREDCYADSPLRVSSNRAFQTAFPDEAKDAAMQLINTARMAEWITTELVPTINKLGEAHHDENARKLKPPVICMQRKYQPISRESTATNHPAGDTLWFSKNFHRIEAEVKPNSNERYIDDREDTVPIQQRLQVSEKK